MITKKRNRTEYLHQWYIDNRKKILERNKKRYNGKRESILLYSKKYYQDNIKKVRKRHREYRKNNREKLIEWDRQYRKDNPEKTKASTKRWHNNNIQKMKNYENNKRRTDLKYKLNKTLSQAIWVALREVKCNRHWEDLVGYTAKELIKHLKKTMPDGYNWKDYMEGKLHIDHIVPKSVFNYSQDKHFDFKRCWALSNLQLLPARENISKNNKLEKPF